MEINYTMKQGISYQIEQTTVYFLFMVYTSNHRQIHFRQGFQWNQEVIYYIPLRICNVLRFHSDDHLLLFLLYKYLDEEKSVAFIVANNELNNKKPQPYWTITWFSLEFL